MLGVNEIKSTETIPSATIVALCEGMLAAMEEPDMRRLRRSDADRYTRTLKTQFKRLDDRYPGIFNVLLEYGRMMPGGVEIMPRIKQMLGVRDSVDAGVITMDEAHKTVDYDLAHQYVRPAIGAERFDAIVPDPEKE